MQVVAAVETAPVPAPTSATLPAAQVLQVEASVSSLYSPAPQSAQAPSSAVVLPDQPWPTPQAAVLWAPQAAVETVLKVPAAHAVQVVAAVETAPVPAPTSATLMIEYAWFTRMPRSVTCGKREVGVGSRKDERVDENAFYLLPPTSYVLPPTS